ncbi:MAG: hypothetical protein CM1200mP40_10660 [Gammaproteobacteria bacterium]|nr:MAG: hypothetical protein CM1200mP40_10660 [Gammaproteobacteria bacterium]
MVNLVTRAPGEEPENSFFVNLTSADGIDTSGFFSRRIGNQNVTVFTSYNSNDAYDPADNGFSAIPEFEDGHLSPGFFF